MENGNTSPKLGVLAEIVVRLAAFTPEQFVPTDVEVGKGDRVVATATDEVKRLLTLRVICADEYNAVAERYNEMVAEDRRRGEKLSSEREAAYEQLNGEMRGQSCLHKVVENLLWLEVRRLHTDFETSSRIGFRKNWEICVPKDDCPGCRLFDGTVTIIDLFGGAPFDPTEFFRRPRGH